MTSAPTLVEQVAAVTERVTMKGLPDELRHDVARRVMDLIGNCLAATDEPPARAVSALVDEWGGREQATAIGVRGRVPAASAALVNGTLAHSLDFDDTHLPSVLHPSSAVLPAAMAVGEARGASGSAIVDAAGMGVEITARLGMAGYDASTNTSVFFERGQHATSICGAIGAAVASAMLEGLGPDGIAHAVGIAASMGAGIIEANRTGGSVKRIHCGWAAHAGVVAAGLARAGITGPPTVFEGRFGFLQAWLGTHADLDVLTADLGERWELPGIFFKPYPCNHFTHAGVDAALRLRAAGLDPGRIATIELGVPSAVLRTIAEPSEAKARPESGYHAAFSGPYTVAAALTGGGGLGLSLRDFTDEAARDPQRLALAARVRCVADADCDRIFPAQLPAVLRVTTVDGKELVERVDVNRGGPDDPLSDEELASKFRDNVEVVLPSDRVQPLASAALGLPTASSIGDLTALLGDLS